MKSRTLSRRAWIVLMTSGCVLLPAVAQGAATGRVTLTRSRIEEREGTWRVLMSIRLIEPPETAQVLLRFVFKEATDKQEARQLEETSEVDFRDVDGAVGREARAELRLSREKGYVPGMWMLRVKRGDVDLAPSVALELVGSG